MTKPNLPKPTLGRLPRYLNFLRSLPQSPGQTVSAAGIARALGLGEVQVRKDLHAACGMGKPRIGYRVDTLTEQLETILGIRTRYRAIVVGAGKLGQALMEFDGFETFGIEIVAGFDKNPETAMAQDTPIFDVAQLRDFCCENEIHIAVLTVPQAAAQQACDLVVAAGIRAIWSFVPVEAPANVVLFRENLALSLAHLCSKVRAQQAQTAES